MAARVRRFAERMSELLPAVSFRARRHAFADRAGGKHASLPISTSSATRSRGPTQGGRTCQRDAWCPLVASNDWLSGMHAAAGLPGLAAAASTTTTAAAASSSSSSSSSSTSTTPAAPSSKPNPPKPIQRTRTPAFFKKPITAKIRPQDVGKLKVQGDEGTEAGVVMLTKRVGRKQRQFSIGFPAGEVFELFGGPWRTPSNSMTIYLRFVGAGQKGRKLGLLVSGDGINYQPKRGFEVGSASFAQGFNFVQANRRVFEEKEGKAWEDEIWSYEMTMDGNDTSAASTDISTSTVANSSSGTASTSTANSSATSSPLPPSIIAFIHAAIRDGSIFNCRRNGHCAWQAIAEQAGYASPIQLRHECYHLLGDADEELKRRIFPNGVVPTGQGMVDFIKSSGRKQWMDEDFLPRLPCILERSMILGDKKLHARRCPATLMEKDVGAANRDIVIERGCPVAGCHWRAKPDVGDLTTSFYDHPERQASRHRG